MNDRWLLLFGGMTGILLMSAVLAYFGEPSHVWFWGLFK